MTPNAPSAEKEIKVTAFASLAEALEANDGGWRVRAALNEGARFEGDNIPVGIGINMGQRSAPEIATGPGTGLGKNPKA